jgi:hypothetical protein
VWPLSGKAVGVVAALRLRGIMLVGMGCLTLLLAIADSGYARSWSVLRDPAGSVGSMLSVSCASARACIAVGDVSVVRWNGSRWMIERIPVPPGTRSPSLSGVSCTSSRACVAVGAVSSATTEDSELVAWRWDSRRWSVQSLPSPHRRTISSDRVMAVSCASSRGCTAVGEGSLIERWDGSRWSLQSVPGVRNGTLRGVSCSSRNACTAVGYIGRRALVARWDGSRWSVQRSPAVTAL